MACLPFRCITFFRATIVAKVLYCSPAWSGFCSAADITWLDAFLKRCKRFCYCPNNFPTVRWTFLERRWSTFFRELLISKHMFLSHYCQPTINTPIICKTDLITILSLTNSHTLTTVISLLDCCINTLINSYFCRIFSHLSCVLPTLIKRILDWWKLVHFQRLYM